MSDLAFGLTWSDAVQFERPDSDAWAVLVGVADALALASDVEGLQALRAAIEEWPDEIRVCPRHWYALYHRPELDLRFELVRTLSLEMFFFGHMAKQAAVWMSALSESPHLGSINLIRLREFGSQASVLDGLTKLFGAAQPEKASIGSQKRGDHEKIRAHLSAEGVLPSSWSNNIARRARQASDQASGLDDREVILKLADPLQVDAMLARTDLDHVVSLQLILEDSALAHRPIKANAPKWASLRHLSVRTHFMGSSLDTLAEPLGVWLQNARPVVVESCDMQLTESLLRAGVYQRAFGSRLDIDAETPWATLIELLRQCDIRVSRFAKLPGHKVPLDRMAPLIEAMPETLRSALMALDWPLHLEEFEQIDALVGALPQLNALQVWSTDLPAHGDEWATALAQAPETLRLSPLTVVRWRANDGLKAKMLNAKQRKVLDRGQGLKTAECLMMSDGSVAHI
ncbi:MAG: hypothetical protein ACE366_02415 [Bradymonadia bacterium]